MLSNAYSFSFSLKREKSEEESSPKSKRGEIGDGKTPIIVLLSRQNRYVRVLCSLPFFGNPCLSSSRDRR